MTDPESVNWDYDDNPSDEHYHVVERAPFGMVPNAIFDDERLTANAMLVAAYIHCRPSDWQLRTAEVANRFHWGRDKTRAAMRCAQQAGWYSRHRRLQDGVWQTMTICYQMGPLRPVPEIDGQGYQEWPGKTPGQPDRLVFRRSRIQSIYQEGEEQEPRSFRSSSSLRSEDPLQSPSPPKRARPKHDTSDVLRGGWNSEPEPQDTPARTGTTDQQFAYGLARTFGAKAKAVGSPGNPGTGGLKKFFRAELDKGRSRADLEAAMDSFFVGQVYDLKGLAALWLQFTNQFPTLLGKVTRRREETHRNYYSGGAMPSKLLGDNHAGS